MAASPPFTRCTAHRHQRTTHTSASAEAPRSAGRASSRAIAHPTPLLATWRTDPVTRDGLDAPRPREAPPPAPPGRSTHSTRREVHESAAAEAPTCATRGGSCGWRTNAGRRDAAHGCGVPRRSPVSGWVRRILHAGPCGVRIRSSVTAWVRHIPKGPVGRHVPNDGRTPWDPHRTAALPRKRLAALHAQRERSTHGSASAEALQGDGTQAAPDTAPQGTPRPQRSAPCIHRGSPPGWADSSQRGPAAANGARQQPTGPDSSQRPLRDAGTGHSSASVNRARQPGPVGFLTCLLVDASAVKTEVLGEGGSRATATGAHRRATATGAHRRAMAAGPDRAQVVGGPWGGQAAMVRSGRRVRSSWSRAMIAEVRSRVSSALQLWGMSGSLPTAGVGADGRSGRRCRGRWGPALGQRLPAGVTVQARSCTNR